LSVFEYLNLTLRPAITVTVPVLMFEYVNLTVTGRSKKRLASALGVKTKLSATTMYRYFISTPE
jgi:hypothetical protein